MNTAIVKERGRIRVERTTDLFVVITCLTIHYKNMEHLSRSSSFVISHLTCPVFRQPNGVATASKPGQSPNLLSPAGMNNHPVASSSDRFVCDDHHRQKRHIIVLHRRSGHARMTWSLAFNNVCIYFITVLFLWWTKLASLLSENDGNETNQRIRKTCESDARPQ